MIKRWLLGWISLRAYVRLSRLRHGGSKGGHSILNVGDVLQILSRTPATFVQIGAYDGVSNDPLSPFIRRHGWRGVLVEPVPRIFRKLVQNYRGFDGLEFANVGIADSAGELDFHSLPEAFDDPPYLQQLGTFERHSIEFNLACLPHLIPHIVTEKVKTVRLADLFLQYRVENPDVLCIDAEGLEYRILKSLPETGVRPKAVIFEWGSMKADDCERLIALLAGLGYSLYKCGGDMIALQKSLVE